MIDEMAARGACSVNYIQVNCSISGQTIRNKQGRRKKQIKKITKYRFKLVRLLKGALTLRVILRNLRTGFI